jgi:hypothetical protein
MVDSKVGFQHGATARVSALGERKNEGWGERRDVAAVLNASRSHQPVWSN